MNKYTIITKFGEMITDTPRNNEEHISAMFRWLLFHTEAQYKIIVYNVLSEWEESFVASIRTQFKQRNRLSDKQFDILVGIYVKVYDSRNK